ncbi:MAG: DEAD/DEAH box helicase [Marinoscillum sp.]
MSTIKSQSEILFKLGIEALNPMQEEAALAIHSQKHIAILSPTGTGKTLAFLLPIIKQLNPDIDGAQVLIIVPSRELAIQIEEVVRNMGSGYKVNALYGGRSASKDREDLKQTPTILIGTPGRIADKIRRNQFDPTIVKTLVLDEFDKSLEVGFEDEMKEIIQAVRKSKKTILTSATQGVTIPKFVNFKNPVYVNYLTGKNDKLSIKLVQSPEKDKLNTLISLLRHIGNEPGIIFCNYKDTISYISDHLLQHKVSHACFYGGMEQIDRERSLIKFRNESHQLLLATDLAARGLDIPELTFIIHYQLPHREEEFTHRNGRTARMQQEGTAYVVQWTGEPLPEFIKNIPEEKLTEEHLLTPSVWTTLFISGGRKDKISKGDIAGVFIKQGGFENSDIGTIEIKQDCAFIAIKKSLAQQAIGKLNNSRIKKKKVRISEA